MIVEATDFEAVVPEKTEAIEIENFIDLALVNAIYYETSYYTQPATKKNKGYALLWRPEEIGEGRVSVDCIAQH